ncbi:MAG: hypothetical protein WBW04_02060 [Nitrolancea sp.]
MVFRRGRTALKAWSSTKERAEDAGSRLEWIGEGLHTEVDTRWRIAKATKLKERRTKHDAAERFEHLAARGAAGHRLGEVIEATLIHGPHSPLQIRAGTSPHRHVTTSSYLVDVIRKA